MRNKLRWTRFGLRSALLSITAMCIALGCWTHDTRRQRAAVAAIREFGGEAYYDYQVSSGYFLILDDPQLAAPAFLRSVLGDDFFQDVEWVIISSDRELTDEVLDHVSRLPKLTDLWLGCRRISRGQVRTVCELRSLRYLQLDETALSDEQIDFIRRSLPDCTVDVEHAIGR